MATRNKKITGEKWARLRGAARWLAARTRSGVAAVGIRGFLLLAIAAGSVWGIELARHHVGQMRAFRVYPERFRAEIENRKVLARGSVRPVGRRLTIRIVRLDEHPAV